MCAGTDDRQAWLADRRCEGASADLPWPTRPSTPDAEWNQVIQRHLTVRLCLCPFPQSVNTCGVYPPRTRACSCAIGEGKRLLQSWTLLGREEVCVVRGKPYPLGLASFVNWRDEGLDHRVQVSSPSALPQPCLGAMYY